jgi:hypothetical protein
MILHCLASPFLLAWVQGSSCQVGSYLDLLSEPKLANSDSKVLSKLAKRRSAMPLRSLNLTLMVTSSFFAGNDSAGVDSFLVY